MVNMRKTYEAAFRAKMILEAVKEEKTLAEPCQPLRGSY